MLEDDEMLLLVVGCIALGVVFWYMTKSGTGASGGTRIVSGGLGMPLDSCKRSTPGTAKPAYSGYNSGSGSAGVNCTPPPPFKAYTQADGTLGSDPTFAQSQGLMGANTSPSCINPWANTGGPASCEWACNT